MEMLKYPHLFSPVTLAGTLFTNRIIASATGHLDTIGSREHGFYHTPQNAAYYERLAVGGAGMVTVGSCYVDKKYGDFGNYHVFLDDPQSLHSFYHIASAITRHGAAASAEIIHCGLYSNRATGEPSYGPVAMEDNGRPVYEMDEDYIASLIDRFANAAAFAKKCGFTMVTIHGGHGWLISQFLNPKLNTRRDRWGSAEIGRAHV
jgi:2,4-dienoyl-CoA reductase-like NADH-dependent reductase (Old Yellow Enzyme family)